MNSWHPSMIGVGVDDKDRNAKSLKLIDHWLASMIWLTYWRGPFDASWYSMWGSRTLDRRPFFLKERSRRSRAKVLCQNRHCTWIDWTETLRLPEGSMSRQSPLKSLDKKTKFKVIPSLFVSISCDLLLSVFNNFNLKLPSLRLPDSSDIFPHHYLVWIAQRRSYTAVIWYRTPTVTQSISSMRARISVLGVHSGLLEFEKELWPFLNSSKNWRGKYSYSWSRHE